MTEYFAICENGNVIDEPAKWTSITSKIVKLGLKINGKIVTDFPIPINPQFLIQCKLATMIGGVISTKLHILGYVDSEGIQYVKGFDFNTGIESSYPITELDFRSCSIKQ